MFLFSKKPKSNLGIDIGASAVKIAEIGKEEERHKLINYGIFPLREYFKRKEEKVSDPLKLSNQELAEIIKRTIQEAKVGSHSAYLSVPVYSSFLTLVELPAMTEKEIASALPFEAKKYVPVPISEVVLDWSIVGPIDHSTQTTKSNQASPINPSNINPPSKPANIQILIIAVPREVINDYNKIMKLAGLNLIGLEEETFSLTRSLIGNDKSTILLVDAGARSINISIIDGGFIRVAHNLEMGGTKIINAVSQQMGLNPERTEELKKNLLAGRIVDREAAEMKGVINSILGTITLEVRKIVDRYQAKYGRKVEKCILAGGVVQSFGFNEYFNNKMDIEVSLGNPFARVIYPPALEPILKELSSSMAVSIGLAMRE